MSKVGVKPIEVPSGVTVTINDGSVEVKGAKATLSELIPQEVTVKQEDSIVTVSPIKRTPRDIAMWGLARALIQNMVIGVTEGYTKKLVLSGVGYRVKLQGKSLKLSLGFSHDIDFPIPDGIEVSCPSQTEIVVSGANKQLVGQVAANIRGFRPPEPYKGKGVAYDGEYIRRKEGKKK